MPSHEGRSLIPSRGNPRSIVRQHSYVVMVIRYRTLKCLRVMGQTYELPALPAIKHRADGIYLFQRYYSMRQSAPTLLDLLYSVAALVKTSPQCLRMVFVIVL